MNVRQYPFLDLVALPAVGRVLFDARPAILWSGDGERVLWANAVGADWLGARRLADVLDRRFSRANPALKEIARLARSMPAESERLARLRFPQGVRTAIVTASCRRLRLPDGGTALLMLALDAAADAAADPAMRLVALLDDGNAAVAVLDARGRALAENERLAEIGIDGDALVRLGAALGSAPDGIASRAVEIDGASWRADMVRGVLSGRGADLLILTPAGKAPQVRVADLPAPAAVPQEPAPEVTAELPAAEETPEEPAPVAPEPLAEAETSLEVEAVADAPAEPEAVPSPADEAPVAETPQAEVPTAEASEEAPTAEAPEVETPPEAAQDEPAGEAPAVEPLAVASPSVPEEAAAPREDEERWPAMPVRFVWQMDAEQRFTSVSPEFARAVGPRSADIVGRQWAELARDLGLESDGIDRALQRRDTWSGATVYWPVDDAAHRIAVDLAALPAFGRDRSFEGFRGFGVARPGDRRPAAEDRAEAELDRRMAEIDRAVAVEAASVEAAPADAVPADAAASNIVPLRAEVKPASEASLSGTERDALRAIAKALGGTEAPKEPDASAPTPDEPAPASSPVEAHAAEPAAPVVAPAGLDPRILDRLPLAVLVYRGAAVLLANRPLLDLLGFESAAALEAAGGIDAIFPQGPKGETPPAEGRIGARRSDGESVAVEARLNTVAWQGSSAFLLSLREAPAPARQEVDEAVAAELKAASGEIGELEAILDTATDGVLVMDGTGTIVSVNRSAAALFGVEPDAVIGSPFTGLLAEESRKAALDYLDGLASNGVASVLNDGREVIGKVPQGGLIPLFMTMGRVGETGKFCAVLRDITQWKNAEEELTAARRAAEDANSQKSEFLAKISHEIRTPLNAIIGFAEMMKEERFGPIGNDRYRDYLRDIHLSGTHLLSLINDLLDLSKIEAGKLDLDFGAVAVNTIIQESVALMQPHANRERIIIRTSLASGLPDVVADPRTLRQIVLNILSNAVKFTEAGGQVIVSTALEESGEVTIRIRDTGIGMSAKDIETALKPFRQVATSGSRAEGTGLGLPLTKALVEANRASFTIDSAPGQGTLVRIAFPSTRVLAG